MRGEVFLLMPFAKPGRIRAAGTSFCVLSSYEVFGEEFLAEAA
jgi:hypothetical protein